MMQVNGEREDIIERIIEKEWNFFAKVNNIGGRADCQDDFRTFQIMRSNQFEAWDQEVLHSYAHDLEQAEFMGQNPVELKYAYMMKDTAPEYYEQKLAPFLPEIKEEKKKAAEQILEWEMTCYHKLREMYPNFIGLGRQEQDSEGNQMTSISVYLRGELYTYSRETLTLYLEMVKNKEKEGSNLIREIYENTAKRYGYQDLEDAERAVTPESG